MTATERADSLLSAVDGRVTRQRREVLIALLEQHGAARHADLQKWLPTHDRVSIYRALDWLVEQGIVEPLATNDGVRRYIVHPANSQPHPHFICENCGETKCLHDVTISSAPLPTGYRIAQVSTLISGTCPACL